MAKIQVNKLYNANVYADGVSFLGKAEEITLPDVTPMMADHKALGMIGGLELPTGWEKMSATIKWNSFYPDVMRKAANPYKAVQMQVRGSLESWESAGRVAEARYVVFLTATFKKFPTGTFKQQENADFESELNVLYVRVEVDGQPVMEFDPVANIYKVDGTDILENYRNNLGA